MRFVQTILFVLTLVGTSCSSFTYGDNEHPAPMRNALTQSDLDGTSGNAYDAVRRLRAFWLQSRSPRNNPTVYMNNVRYGSLSRLLELDVQTIHSMEFYAPMDAVMRWGSGAGGGVINVRTLR